MGLTRCYTRSSSRDETANVNFLRRHRARTQICITTHPDTVLPIRVECKNVATVNIPPKMAASSVISVSVFMDGLWL